jgi:hypothetical protein
VLREAEMAEMVHPYNQLLELQILEVVEVVLVILVPLEQQVAPALLSFVTQQTLTPRHQ